jgi:hypothetical protein
MLKSILIFFFTISVINTTILNEEQNKLHSPSENVFNNEQDITLEVEDDEGTVHYMEVFKSNINDKIIQSKRHEDYSKLKWYSLGIPTLIENKYLNKSLINFNSNGFHIFVQLLTNQHRKRIIKEIHYKYKINADYNQINNIIANKFTCFLQLRCNSEKTKFHGSTKDFSKFPLRVEFDINDKQKECLNRLNEDELTFFCTLNTLSKNEKKNYLKIDSSVYEKINIETEVFGSRDSVYLTRHQLGTISSRLHSNLNILEEYEIDEKEFNQQFFDNFLSQITQMSFEKVSIEEILKHSNIKLHADYVNSKLSKLLSINNYNGQKYVTINNRDESFSSNKEALNDFFELENIINFVSRKENDWKTSQKTINDQLDEINKNMDNEIEWKLETNDNKIVPKSVNVTRLTKQKFKKTISFNRIYKKDYEKLFERSFDLYATKKRIENENVFLRKIDTKFDHIYETIDNLTKSLKSNQENLDRLIFNLNYGTIKNKLTGHLYPIQSLILLSNGDLVSRSDDRSIVIWNTNGGYERKKLVGHTGTIYSFVALANNDLASGGADKCVIIWNTEDGYIKKKLIGHTSAISYLVELEKNGDLVSSGWDGTIIIWNKIDWNIKFR